MQIILYVVKMLNEFFFVTKNLILGRFKKVRGLKIIKIFNLKLLILSYYAYINLIL